MSLAMHLWGTVVGPTFCVWACKGRQRLGMACVRGWGEGVKLG